MIEQKQRKLGDTADQFTVTPLSKEAHRELTQYIHQRLSKQEPGHPKEYMLDVKSYYMLNDSMTGDQYIVASAYNPKPSEDKDPKGNLFDITPIVVQFKDDAIVNSGLEGNAPALKKINIDPKNLPNLIDIPEYGTDKLGRAVSGLELSERLVHPKRMAGLIDEGLSVALENKNPANTVYPDMREKLRNHTTLVEKLSEQREKLLSEINYEDTMSREMVDRSIAGSLYENVFEPEGYTLNKNKDLVSPSDSRLIQNAAFSALESGELMSLDDINGEYLIGKPSKGITDFIRERLEQSEKGELIKAVTLKSKAGSDQTVIYGIAKQDATTGFFDAVTLDQDGMVIATGNDAMANVGIKGDSLNQGQLWNLKNANAEMVASKSENNKQRFVAQINPDNLRREISKAQILSYKASIGKEVSISNAGDRIGTKNPGLDESEVAYIQTIDKASSKIRELRSTEIFESTFKDRFTLTTIDDKAELAALDKITSQHKGMGRGVENRQIVRAIKMQEHWSDNSSTNPNPGKVDSVRMLTQSRVDLENSSNPEAGSVSAQFETIVHTFDDGVYTSSYRPENDKELSLDIRNALKNSSLSKKDDFDDKYQDTALINQEMVFDAAKNSGHLFIRNDFNAIKGRSENGSTSYDNIIKRIEAIDNIANGIDIAPNQSNSAEATAGVRIKPSR